MLEIRSGRFLNGWTLTGIVSLAVVAMALSLAAANGFGVEGIRVAIRATARTSLVLFCLAFAASALHRRWPCRPTAWLRKNRRPLGVSFAASHAAHAVAIVAFARLDPVQFHLAVAPATLVFGGIAYAFIAAMAATSFDRTAAVVGPRAWRLLHRIGAHYIWLIFLISMGRRGPSMPAYFAGVALLLGVVALRLLPSPSGERETAAAAGGS